MNPCARSGSISRISRPSCLPLDKMHQASFWYHTPPSTSLRSIKQPVKCHTRQRFYTQQRPGTTNIRKPLNQAITSRTPPTLVRPLLSLILILRRPGRHAIHIQATCTATHPRTHTRRRRNTKCVVCLYRWWRDAERGVGVTLLLLWWGRWCNRQVRKSAGDSRGRARASPGIRRHG